MLRIVWYQRPLLHYMCNMDPLETLQQACSIVSALFLEPHSTRVCDLLISHHSVSTTKCRRWSRVCLCCVPMALLCRFFNYIWNFIRQDQKNLQTLQGLGSGNKSHCHAKRNTDHHLPHNKCRYLHVYNLDSCGSTLLDSRGYIYGPIWGAPGICWVLHW